MVAVLLIALLAIVLFGIGFTVHVLWWIALALAVLWLIGFVARPHGHRWYYW
jgi:hypothetical protein